MLHGFDTFFFAGTYLIDTPTSFGSRGRAAINATRARRLLVHPYRIISEDLEPGRHGHRRARPGPPRQKDRHRIVEEIERQRRRGDVGARTLLQADRKDLT